MHKVKPFKSIEQEFYLCVNFESMKLLSPKEVQLAQQAQKDLLLIDIREPYEHQNCQIEALHIPMADFATAFPTLPSHEQIVIMCQSGRRAEALVNYIETEFNAQNVFILDGGLNAWITDVAPHLSCE